MDHQQQPYLSAAARFAIQTVLAESPDSDRSDTARSLAKQYGVSAATVYRIAAASPAKEAERERRDRALWAEHERLSADRDAILARLEEAGPLGRGEAKRELAEQYGVSLTAIATLWRESRRVETQRWSASVARTHRTRDERIGRTIALLEGRGRQPYVG